MLMRYLNIFLAVFLISSTGWCTVYPELTQFVSEQVTNLQTAVAQTPKDDGSEFDLGRFLLRLQAKFGIDIPFLTKFQVIPEVEIVVQKSAN